MNYLKQLGSRINNITGNIGHYCGLTLPVEYGHDTAHIADSLIDRAGNNAGILADYLSYRVFDEENKLFLNSGGKNGVTGFMLEIAPIVGIHSDIEKNLTLFFNSELPNDSYLQFLLIASHNIEHKLGIWQHERIYPHPMIKKLTDYRTWFIRRNSKDFASSDGRIGRDFRIYISFSRFCSKQKDLQEILNFKKKLIKKLGSINLSPRVCNAEDLIFISRDLMQMQLNQYNYSGSSLSKRKAYDPYNPISTQILNPLNEMTVSDDCLIFEDSTIDSNNDAANQYNSKTNQSNNNHSKPTGKLASRCFYPKELPTAFSLVEMINLLGSDNDNSLPARLVLSYCVASNISSSNHSKILARGHRAIHASEQWYARHDSNLFEEAANWQDIIAKAKNGEKFLTESLQIMITCPQSELDLATENLVSLYNSHDWQIKVNNKLQLPAMLGILPLQQALYWRLLDKFKLTKLVQSREVVAKLPIQGEWKGMDKSGVLLLGRRGELFNWNPFVRNGAGNYNISVLAPSGSGKSVFLQELATSMIAQDKSVFVLDIGGSYQNIGKMLGGEIIRFDRRGKISLNPFADLARNTRELNTADDEHEETIEFLKIGNHFVAKDSVIYAKTIICSMCGIKDDAHRSAMIEQAIAKGIEKYGSKLDISKLALILSKEKTATANDSIAKSLADTLYPYTEKGVHGRFFAGSNGANFKNILTIFEFEEIKNDPVLLSVVLQIILMQITIQFLYGDRSRQFLLIVDEAWMILDHSSKFLEVFARTVRKYGGSLAICVQNFNDFNKNQERQSILENSAWTVMLKQDEKGLNAFKKSPAFENMIPLIESVHLSPGKYSEILLCSTGLRVIGRLALDPYAQSLYSTDSEDYRFLMQKEKQGMSKDMAIKELAKKYGELPE